MGDKIGQRQVLYVRGAESDAFTLILQGWTVVWAGEEAFESELGPWSYMGNAALNQPLYKPDFSSVTAGRTRLLRVSRASYVRAAEAVARIRPTLSLPQDDGAVVEQLPPASAVVAERPTAETATEASPRSTAV